MNYFLLLVICRLQAYSLTENKLRDTCFSNFLTKKDFLANTSHSSSLRSRLSFFLLIFKNSLIANNPDPHLKKKEKVFIVSLFVYLFHNLFELILEPGNISDKRYI